MLLEQDEAKKNPLSLVTDGHLYIKTKAGELLPFKLNKAQSYVLNLIKTLLLKNKPIRLLILKARQLGMSTLIEAILYSFTSQKENTNSLIIADDSDGSDYLFEMSKLYQDKCPAHLKPAEKKSNAKKLEFDKILSQILIDTAQNKDAGRKYTFRLVHLSEYAFFKYPQELMLGLSQAVPALPGTMIIKESTANGFNHFKDEWDAAIKKETDYIPIFIPWYWDDGYKMTADNIFVIADPLLGDIAKDERLLSTQMESEGIQDIEERLVWRRWCIRNNCANKVANFQQEYPSTPEEAFIASGDCAFDKEQLIKQLKGAKEPLAVGNIVKVDHSYQFRTHPQGDFKLWEKPKTRTTEEYIVSGDACSGSGADYASLQVRAKRTNSVVLTYHGRCDADELAEKAAMLGHYFHDAIIAIENDKYGFHANLKLKSVYGNVYVQETIDREKNIVTNKYGWETNSKTRPEALGQLKEEIRSGAIDINDPLLIRECLTFIKNPDTKKEEAQEGCHDDCVMSAAIGSAIRLMKPYEPIIRDTRPKGPIRGDY